MTGRNSKLTKVADRFRQDILSGVYQPGSRLPTDEEIARDLGINKRTVAGGLSRLVAEGLLTRAPGRGSVVIREKIVTKHTNVVSCIAWSAGDIYKDMEREITSQTLKRGFYPVWVPPSLFNAGFHNETHKQFLQFMEETVNAMPYGMIVYGERFIPYDMLERNLAKIGKLVFICNYSHVKELPAKYVLIDYDAAAKKAVALFRKNGHRKITFISSRFTKIRNMRKITPQYSYHLALKNACDEAGLEYDEKIPQMFWNSEPADEIFKIIRKKGITAAVLGFDSLTQAYSRAMQSALIRIPDDLSVIGFYDTAGPESGLTTFNIQEHVIASTATELLFEDRSEYKKIYIKPELVLRESVRPL